MPVAVLSMIYIIEKITIRDCARSMGQGAGVAAMARASAGHRPQSQIKSHGTTPASQQGL
jgi:hypothetical protein